MMKINVNIRPKSGYVFKEANGTVFRGSTWAQVVKKVTDFRRSNSLPVGNVLEEVMAQACSRNPELCKDSTPPAKRTEPTLKGRVLTWLAQMASFGSKTTLDYVRYPEMKDRAERCLKCPFQKHLATSCASCLKTMNAHTTSILRREHELDRRISACDVLGCYLPVAVWLAEPAVDNERLPGHCWRKKVV